MRLMIAGAGGRTGLIASRLALERGHAVTAFVHSDDNLELVHPSLRVIRGDALRSRDVNAAVMGHDAVLSVLAPRGKRRRGNVYVQGTSNLADACSATGVTRLVVVSAAGAGAEADDLPLPYRLVLRIPVVARLYPDIVTMEQDLISRGGLDWTIVRAAILTNGRARGTYRTAVGNVVPGGLRISRADLAGFLLGVIENDAYVRQRVAVAY